MESEVLESRDKLFDTVKKNHPDSDISRVIKAFDIAYNAHKSQTRHSGAPYITHPLSVAQTVADIGMDITSIAVALLHDVIEDTDVTFEDIAITVGKKEAELVLGVTKIGKMHFNNELNSTTENFCKLLLAISKDIRVLVIKLADRLHNMQTIEFIPNVEKRKRIARETMFVYAALAERMGIQTFKNDLQDIAFAVLYPKIKNSIQARIAFLQEQSEETIQTIVKVLESCVKNTGVSDMVVYGRKKTPFSIWEKMKKKGVNFEQLFDVIAFRILVNTIQECYLVLYAVHSAYKALSSHFSDYISMPKPNGYQSLHTVVVGPQQRSIEIQIRTFEMHEIAEMGFAAHWAYKQNAKLNNSEQMLKESLNLLSESAAQHNISWQTEINISHDQIFCFTPKGMVVALPPHSSIIDFAFAIHSELGKTCVGGRVNNKLVPLKTQLQNGDQVEIIRAKIYCLSPAWLDHIVTEKAKYEIRKFVRSKITKEMGILGKNLLINALSKIGKTYDEHSFHKICEIFGKKSITELLTAIGEHKISTHKVVKVLYPNIGILDKIFRYFLSFKKHKKLIINKSRSSNITMQFATCCCPIPGDNIVGISTINGVIAHIVDCKVLKSLVRQGKKPFEIFWKNRGVNIYTAKIKIGVINRLGVLARVLSSIATAQCNIHDIKTLSKSVDFIELSLHVEVKGMKQLNTLLELVRTHPDVYKIERDNGSNED